MTDPSTLVHVIRRVTLAGTTSEPASCASFDDQAEAERFIQRALAPFAETGSEGSRHWCMHNSNLKVEYWVDFGAPAAEVDRLVEDLMAKERRLIELGDDGAILDELARATRRPTHP